MAAKDSNKVNMQDIQRTILYGLIPVAVLFLLGHLVGLKYLWGMNFTRFLPGLAAPFLVLIVAATFHPGLSAIISEALNSFRVSDNEGRLRGATFFVPFAILMFILFFSFPSGTVFLGDGNLRVNQIGHEETFLITEMLDFFLHSQLHRLFLEPIDLSVVDTYRVFSALCGIIYIIGLYKLAVYMNPKQSLITFLLMFSSGVTVLFFGYVESYSLIAALLPAIMLSALKVIDGRKPRKEFILWFVIGVLVHSVAAILLGGALLVIMLTNQNADPNRKPVLALGAVAVAGIVLLYVAYLFGWMNVNYYLMPILPVPDFQHSILSVNHYLNLLNWLLVAAVPFLALAPTIIAKPTLAAISSNKRVQLALGLAVPAALFMFFFIPRLGGPRDWDIFALAAYMLVPAALIVFFETRSSRLPSIVIPVIAISIFTTVSFVAVNYSVARSTDRFVEILEVSKFKNMFKEYGTLFTHSQTYPELQDRQLEFATKAWEQPPYTKVDSVFMLQKLSGLYTNRGQRDVAWEHLLQAYKIDTLNLFTHVMMVNYLNRFATTEDIVGLAETIERRFPQNAKALMLTGRMYIQAGDTARGEANMQQALELDVRDFNVLFNYGSHMLAKRDFNRAAELLKMAYEISDKDFLGCYYLGTVLVQLGQADEAVVSINRARHIAETDEQKAMCRDLESDLRFLRTSLQNQ